MATRRRKRPSSRPPRDERYRAFARAYVKHGNGTRAAIEAGFAAGSAHVTASRLIRLAKVQAYIEQYRAKVDEKHSADVSAVVKELERIARFDLGSAFKIDPETKQITLKPLDEIETSVFSRFRVSTVTVKADNGDEISKQQIDLIPYSKVQAGQTLLKHHGELPDILQVSGKGGEPIKHEHEIAGIKKVVSGFRK